MTAASTNVEIDWVRINSFFLLIGIAIYAAALMIVSLLQGYALAMQNVPGSWNFFLLAHSPFLAWVGTFLFLLGKNKFLTRFEKKTGYSIFVSGFGIVTAVSVLVFVFWVSTPNRISVPEGHVRIMETGEVYSEGSVVSVPRMVPFSVTVPMEFQEGRYVNSFLVEGGRIRVGFTYSLKLDSSEASILLQGQAEGFGLGLSRNIDYHSLSEQEIAQHEAIFFLGQNGQNLNAFLRPKLEQVLAEMQVSPLPVSEEGLLVRFGQLIQEDRANMPVILDRNNPIEISSFEILEWSTNP